MLQGNHSVGRFRQREGAPHLCYDARCESADKAARRYAGLCMREVSPMGKKDVEALDIAFDDLPTLPAHEPRGVHGSGRRAVLPDRRERPATGARRTPTSSTRRATTSIASPLVPTIAEFLELPFREGRSVPRSGSPRPPSTHPATARTCPRISKRRRVFSEAVCLLFLRRSRTPRCRKDASGFVL